ncbi:Uma2 family endonuclease [Pseudanabaenaceae cyanobacterium LEGE 13415]|nr:Uma2 family endonuclease [Pseudanabaenaceae cyanobacterium LEGE 13415]
MLVVTTPSPIVYPESDGKPIADNTRQFELIVYVKKGIDWLFADQPQVFVAGDLLWYPIEGNNKLCQAPDAMIVFGRPKGDRRSYQQWKEDNLPPQVVFEILSPSNTPLEMTRKFQFYERYGVDEYYVFDPDRAILDGYLRQGTFLESIDSMQDWISPRLRIRFSIEDRQLQLFRPDDTPFETYEQIASRAEQERLRADRAEERVQQAEDEIQRLREQLRALGQNPSD